MPVVSFVWRLLAGALAFVAGMVLGGSITTALGMQPPTLPPEVDTNMVTTLMLATSPLLIVALYFVNRELAGGWLARSAALFLLSWIAYSVNNVIEATIFTSYETASWFTLVSFLPAILFSAMTVAWLFPSRHGDQKIGAVWSAYFRQHNASGWTWRLLLAAVVFVPIYYLFGMLVLPFVGDTYAQGDFGLTVPSLNTLILVLLGRSLLFLIACLPVIIAWQGERLALFLTLGFALFVMVGLLYMLAATWIALPVRVAHSFEILADSMLYAGALAWLLRGQRDGQPLPASKTASHDFTHHKGASV